MDNELVGIIFDDDRASSFAAFGQYILVASSLPGKPNP